MTRTQWLVVIGLLGFILVIFGILLFQLQVPQAPPTPLPPAFLLEQEAQARRALSIAQQAAQAWQPDAYLTWAQITWDDLGPGGILKRDHWLFQFYSPSNKHVVLFQVSNGAARRLDSHLSRVRPPALPIDQWQIDSTQAFETWWQRGGGDFVRLNTQVSISLKLRPQDDHPLWSVVGSAGGQHWIVQIDASDGAVIE